MFNRSLRKSDKTEGNVGVIINHTFAYLQICPVNIFRDKPICDRTIIYALKNSVTNSVQLTDN